MENDNDDANGRIENPFRRWYDNYHPRRFEMLLFFPWVVFLLWFSVYVVGAKLFLICVYGFSRVWNENLTLINIPKTKPYIVSNGDLITEGHFTHFVISCTCWLLLGGVSRHFLRRLLPEEEQNK